MTNTAESKDKLLARIRHIRGQVAAIEKFLKSDQECVSVLQLVAAARGAIGILMNEVMEGHVRHYVLRSRAGAGEWRDSEDLAAIVRSYFK